MGSKKEHDMEESESGNKDKRKNKNKNKTKKHGDSDKKEQTDEKEKVKNKNQVKNKNKSHETKKDTNGIKFATTVMDDDSDIELEPSKTNLGPLGSLIKYLVKSNTYDNK